LKKDHSPEEVNDFFKRADTDGDGFIQLLEYVSVVRSSLEKAGLSYDEFEEMAKSKKINWVIQKKRFWIRKKKYNIYCNIFITSFHLYIFE